MAARSAEDCAASFVIHLALAGPGGHRRLYQNLTAQQLHFTPFVKGATLGAFGYGKSSLQRSETARRGSSRPV